MKILNTTILFFLFGFTNLTFSQSYFRFVDKKTGETLYAGNAEIIMDGFLTFAEIVKKGEKGVYTYRAWDSQFKPLSASRFYLSVDNRKYLPVWTEVNLSRKDTLKIELTPDLNFVKQEEGFHFNGCGSPVYSQYYPRPFRSWEEIPEDSRTKIFNWLENWVGKGPMSQIYISSGLIFKGSDMHKAGVKNLYSDGQIVYRICLSFSDPEKGIGQYSSELYFTDSGRLMNNPQFPVKDVFGNVNAKWIFLSEKEMENKARKDGYFEENKTVSFFEFYPRLSTFVWGFRTFKGKTKTGEIQETVVHYDAFTGDLVAIFFDKKSVFEN